MACASDLFDFFVFPHGCLATLRFLRVLIVVVGAVASAAAMRSVLENP